MNTLFLDNSIAGLLKKLAGKKLSPRDLSSAVLENIRELDPKYFAWVLYGDEKLFARQREESGVFGDRVPRLLQDIPIGVKDIYNTAEFPTQMGSSLWKGFTPGNDARAVFNLKRNGAIVAGKTVTAEFAVHTLDKTLNPYDVTKTPGTSSSGSAVAVSLGMVPAAVGTQTAGSIIRPASFCGVYGAKPSFGTIPRTGMLKTTDSLDTIGFFAVYQEDLRRMFDAMRVHGLNYPISNAALTDTVRQNKRKGKPWRVGVARTHTWKYAPPYAKDALTNFADALSGQRDIEISEAKLPSSMTQAHGVHEDIYNKALSYYFQQEYSHGENVSPVMKDLIEKGNKVSIQQYREALSIQSEIIRGMDKYFGNFDVIISLSTAGDAPLRNVFEQPDPALMWTLAHVPVVGVPLFHSPVGMPFGVQLVARKYNDYLLFSFLDYLAEKGLIPKKASAKVEKLKLEG